jgi:hypothetical protein
MNTTSSRLALRLAGTTVERWCARAALAPRHHPRKRVIQYSRDVSDRAEKPRRTGYPAFAGYDDFRSICIQPHTKPHGSPLFAPPALLRTGRTGYISGPSHTPGQR